MSETKKNTFHYGGQAVIEGVMMRGPEDFAIACRRENGEIVVSAEPVANSILGRLKWLNKPFLRGTLAMADTLILGMKALMFSANIAMEDAQVADAASKAKKADSRTVESGRKIAADVIAERTPSVASDASGSTAAESAGAAVPTKSGSVNEIALSVMLFVGLALGVVLFMLVPTALTIQLKRVMSENRIWFGLVEGGIKIALFVGYVSAISLMKDIRRIFQYHGAEHKIINAYEAGEDLTVESAAKHTTIHVRCGTSFILVVLISSILIFSLIPWNTILERFAYKLLLLPIVAGVAYETIKLAGRNKNSRLLRVILAPGLLMQRITTKQPEPDQVEIAITALKSVFEQERKVKESASEPAAETHH